MAKLDTARETQLDRCVFGIDELDAASAGGIPRGSTVLLAGGSGTGKTILCMQWLFSGYSKANEPGIYLSLTEPIMRSISNLKSFSFYRPELLNPTAVHLTDLRSVMKDMSLASFRGDLTLEDADKVIDVIANMVQQSGAKRLVLDSITAVCYRLNDVSMIRDFIFRLGMTLGNLDCTTLLISEVPESNKGYSVYNVEEFISDGIMKLTFKERQYDIVRSLTIVKMRGTSFDQKPLHYKITPAGVVFFPRLAIATLSSVPPTRMAVGISGFDALVGGGMLALSTTIVAGAAGTGKSLLAASFLVEGARKGERCLLISYEEQKAQIARNMQSFGIDLAQLERSGTLQVLTIFPADVSVEENLLAVKGALDKLNPKRVVIDSITSLIKAYTLDAFRDFMVRINYYLKNKGCTTVLTHTNTGLIGEGVEDESEMSSIADNIILLRYVEIDSSIRRFISALKVRGSDHDKTLREYEISAKGMIVKEPFKGVEGVLSGSGRRNMDEKYFNAFKDLARET